MSFDFSLFSNSMNGIDLGIGGTAAALIIIAVTTFAITTNTRHIRLSLFPIAFGFKAIGLEVHYIILVALGVLWVITIVGTHEIGTILTTIPGMVKEKIVVSKREKELEAARYKYGIKQYDQAIALKTKGWETAIIDGHLEREATRKKHLEAHSKKIGELARKKLKVSIKAEDARREQYKIRNEIEKIHKQLQRKDMRTQQRSQLELQMERALNYDKHLKKQREQNKKKEESWLNINEKKIRAAIKQGNQNVAIQEKRRLDYREYLMGKVGKAEDNIQSNQKKFMVIKKKDWEIPAFRK